MVDSTDYSMVVRLDERLVDRLVAMMDGKMAEMLVQMMVLQMVARRDGTKAAWREPTMVESTVE